MEQISFTIHSAQLVNVDLDNPELTCKIQINSKNPAETSNSVGPAPGRVYNWNQLLGPFTLVGDGNYALVELCGEDDDTVAACKIGLNGWTTRSNLIVTYNLFETELQRPEEQCGSVQVSWQCGDRTNHPLPGSQFASDEPVEEKEELGYAKIPAYAAPPNFEQAHPMHPQQPYNPPQQPYNPPHFYPAQQPYNPSQQPFYPAQQPPPQPFPPQQEGVRMPPPQLVANANQPERKLYQLLPGQKMTSDQKMWSRNEQFFAVMQGDGNFVVYSVPDKPVFDTSTHGHGPETYFVFQKDGNLVVYNRSNKPLWNSGTHGKTASVLELADDGALYLRYNNNVVWCTKPVPVATRAVLHHAVSCHGCEMKAGERLEMGQSLRSSNNRYVLKMQSDGNLVLYDGERVAWASHSNGSKTHFVFQPDGNLVVYSNGDCPLWNAGTHGNPNASHLVLQDDGNLVLYSSSKQPLWHTHTSR